MLLERFCRSSSSGDTGSGGWSCGHSPQRKARRLEQGDRCGRGTKRDTHQSRSTGGTGAGSGTGAGAGTGPRTTHTERRTPVTGREVAAVSGTRRTCGSSREGRSSTTRGDHSTEGSGDQNPELRQSKSKPKGKASVNKQKPSSELSGTMPEDINTFQAVVIKDSEHLEARIPRTRWCLCSFKNDELLVAMFIHRQGAYLLGRHRRIALIPIAHPSCSEPPGAPGAARNSGRDPTPAPWARGTAPSSATSASSPSANTYCRRTCSSLASAACPAPRIPR